MKEEGQPEAIPWPYGALRPLPTLHNRMRISRHETRFVN